MLSCRGHVCFFQPTDESPVYDSRFSEGHNWIGLEPCMSNEGKRNRIPGNRNAAYQMASQRSNTAFSDRFRSRTAAVSSTTVVEYRYQVRAVPRDVHI